MASEQELKKRIQQLQEELLAKDTEIARYRNELMRANLELERIILDLGQETKMAGVIQKVLSPTEIPNIQGFEFSSKFVPGTDQGGDYFDIFEIEDRMRFGILLAASSGYAMSSMFLSVLIKLTSHLEARKGVDPDKAIAQLAKELVPHIENQDSSSVFYAIIDRRSFEMTCCSVGNTMAFLSSFGDDKVARIEPSCGPISKNFNEQPLAQKIQLGARDRLVFVSEGVTGALNPSSETFGVDRLGKCILKTQRGTVHDVRNELLFELEQFCESEQASRDRTVIVAEVKDRVIKLAKS